MRNKKMKAALLMLALGAMVPAANLDSQAAEAEASQVESVEEAESAETVEETEAAETAEETEDAAAVQEDGWVNENGGTRYYVNGSYVTSTVMKISGSYYGFDSEGMMYTNTTFGLFDYEDYQYYEYHAKKSGKLVVNNWYQNDYGDYYYYGEGGRAVNGMQTIGGKQYYFNNNGMMEKDVRVQIDDVFYLVDEDGNVFNFGKKAGWKKANDKFYYIREVDAGDYTYLEFTTNRIVKIGTSYYAFDGDGAMYENCHVWWVYDVNGNSATCFAGKDGVLFTNQWVNDSYSRYYFTSDGTGANGIRVLNDKKYYFDSGRLVTNSTIKTDGKFYVVDSDGICYEAKDNAWTYAAGSYYYVKDGQFLQGCVEKIGSYYYGFDWSGRMYDDTEFSDNGNYRAKKGGKLYVSAWYNNYYYGKDGKAPEGLKTLSKVQYFFRDGEAISDEYICVDGKLYYADANCALKEITKNGFFYENANKADFVYIKNKAPIKNEWLKAAGKYYYFGEDGYAYRKGLAEIKGKWYYFNEDGTLVTSGWVKEEYGSYYASASGALLTGDQQIGGKWYHFDEDGYMRTGLVETEKGMYLYGTDGVYIGQLKKGWIEVNGAWYYAKDGQFADDIVTIGSNTFYFEYGRMMTDALYWKGSGALLFDKKGHQVKKGWYQIEGDWYYVLPDTGSIANNQEVVIDGKTYVFDSDGKMHVTDWDTTSGLSRTLYSVNADGSLKSKKEIADGWTLHAGAYYYYKNGMPYTGWVGNYYVKNGQMLRNEITPTGYWVGQDGSYQKTAGWVKDWNGNLKGIYAKAGGKLAYNEWLTIGSKKYYFGGYNGYYRQTGVQRIDGVWYIFDNDGALLLTLGKTLPNGWKQAGENWYYFKGKNIVNGALNIGGKIYGFDSSRMVSGPGFDYSGYNSPHYQGENGRYYLNKDSQAELTAGWRQIDGKWYYFGVNYKAPSYQWVSGGSKVYFQDYYGMVTGYKVIREKLYQFGTDGALIKAFNYEDGWQKIGGNWYYFRDGRVVTGDVITVGGKTYLFDYDGTLACNEMIGAYYADANGVIVTNKLMTFNGKNFYFGADGRRYYGVWKINGKLYYFDD